MKSINIIGFWSGIAAFAFTISYCIVQVLQVAEVVHFPLDEILIFGTSLAIVIPFLIEMLSFHYITAEKKKFWTSAALIFSILYAVFVIANYVVQLATVIPARLSGTVNKIQLLQQTPHSLFWDFDALGYIFMGMATLFAILAIEKRGFKKWVRLSFIANVCVTPLIAIVYFYPTYSENLLIIGYPWALTAPASMLLLALFLKRTDISK